MNSKEPLSVFDAAEKQGGTEARIELFKNLLDTKKSKTQKLAIIKGVIIEKKTKGVERNEQKK